MLLQPWQQPKPTTFTLDNQGDVVDPYSIEYAVDDAAGTNYIPFAVATRLGLGYFEATTYAAGVPAAGRRTIRWRMKLLVTDTTYREWSQAWDTYRIATAQPVYALISDMRDQDITTTMISDARARVLLLQASLQVERFTGRRFGARQHVFLADGRGGPMLMFDEPVIAVSELVMGAESLESTELAIEAESYRVYNRHLLGQLTPDDRENPKLEFRLPFDRSQRMAAQLSGWRTRFPEGAQNIRVSGLFGYTEPDGSPAGAVPSLITYVTVLLAARNAATIGNPTGGVVDQLAWKVTEERTRDQAVKYTSASGGSSTGTGRGNALQGAFTGDPSIDTILAMFCRGPRMSAA